MKVSAVIVTLAICVAFYHRGVEASVSKCYHCSNTCSDPFEEEQCSNTYKIDYKCVSAKAKEGKCHSLIVVLISKNYLHRWTGVRNQRLHSPQ
jgi:hypothetical protein